MSKNRKIFFTITVDYEKSMQEIKNRNSGCLMEIVDKAIKVAAPIRTKLVLGFLKVKKGDILVAFNEYLQQYHLGQIGDITMRDIADRKIFFELRDTKIHYQELSELDMIQKEFLKKVIRSMKHTWIEERVIALLNTEIGEKKILKEISPIASEFLFENWGICAYISSFGIV